MAAIKKALTNRRDKSAQSIQSTAKQLDYLRNIKLGDRVLIYGHNAILGVGEVTGSYEYVPEEWPAGSGDGNHHQYQVHWLTTDPKGLEPLPKSLQRKLQRPPTIFDLSQQEAQIILEKLYPEIIMQNGIIDKLNAYLTARGFHFPRELLTTYYLSLQTKPFVILTGISGTGKTKLAQLFAEWMSSAVEEQVTETETPEDDDETFHLEVKPYYFKKW